MDDKTKGELGLLGLLGLFGARSSEGKEGPRGPEGPRGLPGSTGFQLIGYDQPSLPSPAAVSQPMNGYVNVIYPGIPVPSGTTHICAMVTDQVPGSGVYDVECINAGIMFLPWSVGPLPIQLSWVFRTMAPLAGGETQALVTIVFLRLG